MDTYFTEFAKVRRSLSWAVVIVLPLAMVAAGAVTTLTSGQQPAEGWHTIWLRSVVFHGLFPLALGIAIIASLVWRPEHRGSNWNALMSGPTSTVRILAAKAAVTATLAAVMQCVLVLGVLILGKGVWGLEGWLPARYLAVSAVIVLACVPVAVLQSSLSMLMRSFAAPLAVAFVGAGVSVVLLLTGLDAVAVLLPYATAARATQLGTGTFADAGTIEVATVAGLAAGAVVLSGLLVLVSTAFVERRDTRT